ncbi:Hydrolase, TatD family [Zostera marina]|uniref:Hydrolase, TatD family n=1 Tax=Zostera marina TaxID=29655 RepID=A0A0K9PMG3_ZOSMR|nr:Hydrolase, TatD family [Zostera marina]
MTSQAPMRIFDAHCHLQDNRIYRIAPKLIRKATEVGVQRFTINGIFEGDWHLVKQMADEYPSIIPSFGLHPWYVGERSPNWFENLKGYIDSTPSAAIGEIGLDRGSYGRIVNFETQVDVFQKQLEFAKSVKRPVSIHCVNAFGRLLEILQRVGPFPEAVVLHSYVGSSEMVSALAKLGCYFSFSGHLTFHSHAKAKKTVNLVPIDKILLETDAPDGLPKFDNSMSSLLHAVRRNPHASQNDLENQSQSEDTNDATDEQSLPEEKLNHPANIRAILTYIADLRELPEEELAEICYKNAVRVFSYEGSKISPL